MKVSVKEGWADKETGKKGEPRLQFLLVQYLQDVLPAFAKKLIIHVNIKDLQTEMITKLSEIFQLNRGDNPVTFEVMELEKIRKQIETIPIVLNAEEAFDEAAEMPELEEPELSVPAEIEETRIITRLSMPSRKLKIRISNELLAELEKMQINFKLN